MALLVVTFITLLTSALATESGSHTRNSRGVDLSISDHDLNVAIKYAEDYVSRMQRLEKSLTVADIDVEDSSPSHGQLIDALPTPEALLHGKSAMVANRASLYLAQRHCRKHHIPQNECQEVLKKWSLDKTALRNKCAMQFGAIKCRPGNKYRSFDGTCNHESHPSWGQSYSPYKRLIPAHYADGILEPKRSLSKRPLPSARHISNVLVPDLDKPDDDSTLAFAQWAQFIANDLFQTPVHKMVHTGSSIECCRRDGRALTPRYIHPHCLQITISDRDEDYAPYNVKCMNYVRSLTSLRDQCNFGSADQMNQASHYLDASMMYGNTATRAISLRSMSGGRLSTVIKFDEEFLPMSVAPEVQCQILGNDTICYQSGDSRVNQHPHHTAMYTIWVREHNRVADALSNLNPHWEDKKIFQEARRIVIAQIQHITYKKWLPIVLGKSFSEVKGLEIKNKGFGSTFGEDIDPSVSNGFATAGFNFVFSLLQKEIRLYSSECVTKGVLHLNEHFNRPAVTLREGAMDSLLRGLIYEKSQKMDPSLVEDVTSKLYRGKRAFGHDIMSLDIQRGRDHGLPGYNAYRKMCKLPTSSKFETFQDTITQANILKIKSVYDHPDDVDLVIGAIMETPASGAKVGPTLQCLLAEQFIRTRRGDRFFYDIDGQPQSFTEAQVNELKKASLARVLCDNAGGIDSLQIDVFHTNSPTNPLVECLDSRIPIINLSAWKDTK